MNCDSCSNFKPVKQEGNTALLVMFTSEQLIDELNKRTPGCGNCSRYGIVEYEFMEGQKVPYRTYCWNCLWNNWCTTSPRPDNFKPRPAAGTEKEGA